MISENSRVDRLVLARNSHYWGAKLLGTPLRPSSSKNQSLVAKWWFCGVLWVGFVHNCPPVYSSSVTVVTQAIQGFIFGTLPLTTYLVYLIQNALASPGSPGTNVLLSNTPTPTYLVYLIQNVLVSPGTKCTTVCTTIPVCTPEQLIHLGYRYTRTTPYPL